MVTKYIYSVLFKKDRQKQNCYSVPKTYIFSNTLSIICEYLSTINSIIITFVKICYKLPLKNTN